MLDRLREQEESMMLAMLSDIGVIALAPTSIVLAASPGNFSRQKLQSPGPNQERFFAWLQEEQLDPTKIQWKDQAPSLPQVPSWSLFTANARKQHRNEVSQKARSHPAVTQLVDAMDAEITSLRVLRDHRDQPLDPPLER